MRRTLPFASSSVSAILFAALPKCPACLILLLAPFGIRIDGAGSFLLCLAVMLVSISLLMTLVPACRTCGRQPLILACAGAVAMVAGRFVTDNNFVVAAGVVLMFTAAVRTARASVRTAACSRNAATCEAGN